jgi:hypothetical protein
MDSSRLAAIPFFADLPEGELAAVAGVASEVEIQSGQALAGKGGSAIRRSPSRVEPPTSSSRARRWRRRDGRCRG